MKATVAIQIVEGGTACIMDDARPLEETASALEVLQGGGAKRWAMSLPLNRGTQ
jgi:hypothetical protein